MKTSWTLILSRTCSRSSLLPQLRTPGQADWCASLPFCTGVVCPLRSVSNVPVVVLSLVNEALVCHLSTVGKGHTHNLKPLDANS